METIVTLLIGALAAFFLFFKKGEEHDVEIDQKLQDRADELKKESDKIDSQLKEKVKDLNDKEVVDYWKNHE